MTNVYGILDDMDGRVGEFIDNNGRCEFRRSNSGVVSRYSVTDNVKSFLSKFLFIKELNLFELSVYSESLSTVWKFSISAMDKDKLISELSATSSIDLDDMLMLYDYDSISVLKLSIYGGTRFCLLDYMLKSALWRGWIRYKNKNEFILLVPYEFCYALYKSSYEEQLELLKGVCSALSSCSLYYYDRVLLKTVLSQIRYRRKV